MLWHEGDVVAFWNGSTLDVAVAVREEKQRVRLILADGKETRVPRGRLAFVVERGGGRSEDGAAERARAAVERIRGLADRVDVDPVWQLAEAESGPVELDALVELALGSDSGEHRAAVVTAFLEDGIRFVRRGDRFDPRDADSVRSLLHEREVAGRRETHRDAAHAVLARAARGEAVEPDDDNPVLRAYLDALWQQAVYDLDVPDAARDTAAEALRASGLAFERPVEGAFRLLRRFGRFDHDDVNLEIERYAFRTGFPDAVLDRARASAEAGFDRAGRVDLTGQEVVSIDSASTREIDDALSIEPRDDGGFRFGVHIADPSAIVDVGDPVDEEAFARGATLYFPDRKLTMLPTRLSEGGASLVEGEERPALSFLLDVDEDGRTRGGRICRSVIRVRARLDYAAVDEGLRDGGRFTPFDRVARALERTRLSAGALLLLTADVDVRVGEDGEPVLERLEAESPSRRIVTEAMIAAGAFAARWAGDAGVRLIHRTQVRPPGAEEFAGRVVADPVEIRRARMSLRRGETGIEPGEHFALGLPAYAQVTSPLRRYQDLANHRQIVAALLDEPAPYDEERLRRIAAATERVEIDGRRAERRANRYWRLRALQTRVGEVLEGVVVDASHRPVVDLPEIGLEEQVAGLEGAEAGRRVALRIVRVEPRADILRLRPEV